MQEETRNGKAQFNTFSIFTHDSPSSLLQTITLCIFFVEEMTVDDENHAWKEK